jgi:hypothetical protein
MYEMQSRTIGKVIWGIVWINIACAFGFTPLNKDEKMKDVKNIDGPEDRYVFIARKMHSWMNFIWVV